MSDPLELLKQSELFDEDWYLAKYADSIENTEDVFSHYLNTENALKNDPGPYFSTTWYLETYPDIQSSGMNPLVHFILHGHLEGRSTLENRALELDQLLWAKDDSAQAALEDLSLQGAPQEQSFARWSLARWFAFKQDWRHVARYMLEFKLAKLRYPRHLGPMLLGVDALTKIGRFSEAWQWLNELLKEQPEHFDLCLAASNLVFAEHSAAALLNDDYLLANEKRLEWLNRFFVQKQVLEIHLKEKDKELHFENLSSSIHEVGQLDDSALVSVIMPLFNAERTLKTAVESLLQQSYNNLEIIIVDDCSTDSSFSLALALRKQDSRVRVFRQLNNGGAYAARNLGLLVSRGDFITTHDADDWSHPQKIEKQLEVLLQNEHLQASTSHWVRCTDDLVFGRWLVEEGWIYRNVSSLMFRRTVFDTLGFWDRVSVNADTEYYYRIIRAYGREALTEVLTGTPLAFGRFDSSSLSQTSETHLKTQFSGVRKDYQDAALAWHESIEDIKELYLPSHPLKRPFPAPDKIRRPPLPSFINIQDSVQQVLASGLFDEDWYRRQNPELDFSILAPLEHFVLHGGLEGRDPSSHFSTSAYMLAFPDVAYSNMNPLLHYLKWGKRLERIAFPRFKGAQLKQKDAKRIMLVGHFVGKQMFGAERSFLDLLRAATELAYEVYVVLPSASNPTYINSLLNYCTELRVVPYEWWYLGRKTDISVQKRFQKLLSAWKIDLMHVNTLVLHEPLIAAKLLKIPTLVHVRELPEHDPALCQTLKASPEDIRQAVLKKANGIIANSTAVAQYLQSKENTRVLANTVDLDYLDIENVIEVECIKVALISSNLPKKGIEDFVNLASALQTECANLEFVLIGPQTPYFKDLLKRQEEGSLPVNLVLADYAETPKKALEQINIIVNLSHFQESFGRTILEAMAARRPAICYNWGALSDLVVESETGFLVAFKDIEACAEHLKYLAGKPEIIKSMGEAARQRVQKLFSLEVFKSNLDLIYKEFIGKSNQELKVKQSH